MDLEPILGIPSVMWEYTWIVTNHESISQAHNLTLQLGANLPLLIPRFWEVEEKKKRSTS